MRVKIGNQWIDSKDQDLCVEFESHELAYIKDEMTEETAPNRRFAAMEPRGRTPDEMRAWIRECD